LRFAVCFPTQLKRIIIRANSKRPARIIARIAESNSHQVPIVPAVTVVCPFGRLSAGGSGRRTPSRATATAGGSGRRTPSRATATAGGSGRRTPSRAGELRHGPEDRADGHGQNSVTGHGHGRRIGPENSVTATGRRPEDRADGRAVCPYNPYNQYPSSSTTSKRSRPSPPS